MELLAENLSLCKPNKRLISEGKFGDFRTPYQDVPRLGQVCLSGSRSSLHRSEQGVFVSDQLYKIPVLKFDSLPCFFNLQVVARPAQDIDDRIYICRLKFPQTEKVLIGDLEFSEDDLEENLFFRFIGMTYNWKISEELKTYSLFGLKHPLYLSGLSFSFGYI